MSIFRNLLMEMGGSPTPPTPTPVLPTEYQEVEYLESNGNQYIMTDYYNTTATEYKFKVQMLGFYGQWNTMFGARYFYNSADAFDVGFENNYTIYINIGGPNPVVDRNLVLNQDYEFVVNKDSIKINNNITTLSNSLTDGQYKIYLFVGNQQNSLLEPAPIRMYYFQIYEDSDLVMSFVPCYRKSDGEAGLYDLITQTFFTNSGTGNFVLGGEVNPEPRLPSTYQELEYISIPTGGYIDTQVIPTNHTTDIIFDFGTYLNDEFLFGTNVSESWKYYFAGAYNNGYSFGHNNTDYTNYPNIWTAGQHHLVYNGANNAITMDDTLMETGRDIASHSNLLIGKRNAANFEGKIYYVKITDKTTGNDVRELIPCYRKSDDEVGLYDIIGDTFYTNSGTGTFAKGPEVLPGQNLPSAYKKVEYIESDGRQKIYTNYYMNVNTIIELEMYAASTSQYPPTNNGWMQVTGARQNYHLSTSMQLSYNLNSHNCVIDYGTNGNGMVVSPEIKFPVRIQNNNHSINNTSITQTGTFSGTCPYPLWVFDVNMANSTEGPFTGRIYSYKIKEGNTLIMDLIPCKRISDSVVGMYDIVGRVFYVNKGSGTFTAGPEV